MGNIYRKCLWYLSQTVCLIKGAFRNPWCSRLFTLGWAQRMLLVTRVWWLVEHLLWISDGLVLWGSSLSSHPPVLVSLPSAASGASDLTLCSRGRGSGIHLCLLTTSHSFCGQGSRRLGWNIEASECSLLLFLKLCGLVGWKLDEWTLHLVLWLGVCLWKCWTHSSIDCLCHDSSCSCV